MARRKRKERTIEQLETPTLAQMANGDFDRDFITHAETNTKAMAYRSRESCIVERWCREGGPGFDIGAQRIIANCQSLWLKLGTPNLVAHYGERGSPSTHGDGWGQQEALDQLHFYKEALGAKMQPFWLVYENVVRHNEPAGAAGSSFAKHDVQRIQSAKVITGMVASFLAGKLGY